MTSPTTAATHNCAPYTIGIEAAAYELPGERQDINDWAQQYKLPAERIDMIRNAGCRYFHVAPDIDEVELAKRAVARLQEEQGFKGSDIGALIHVHTGLFSIPPAPRSLPPGSGHGLRHQAYLGRLDRTAQLLVDQRRHSDGQGVDECT